MKNSNGNLAIDTNNLMIRKRPKQKGEMGKVVIFDKTKIVTAIESAMFLTPKGIDSNLSNTIAHEIALELKIIDYIANVEEIQDIVEKKLMTSNRQEVAVNYILYRNQKSKERNVGKPEYDKLITDDFISKYKHLPGPMSAIGKFVFYRTYSR